MPIPKNRGKVVRTRTVKVPGSDGKKYMHCEVMEEPGPRGGRTSCIKHRKKGANKGD